MLVEVESQPNTASRSSGCFIARAFADELRLDVSVFAIVLVGAIGCAIEFFAVVLDGGSKDRRGRNGLQVSCRLHLRELCLSATPTIPLGSHRLIVAEFALPMVHKWSMLSVGDDWFREIWLKARVRVALLFISRSSGWLVTALEILYDTALRDTPNMQAISR